MAIAINRNKLFFGLSGQILSQSNPVFLGKTNCKKNHR